MAGTGLSRGATVADAAAAVVVDAAARAVAAIAGEGARLIRAIARGVAAGAKPRADGAALEGATLGVYFAGFIDRAATVIGAKTAAAGAVATETLAALRGDEAFLADALTGGSAAGAKAADAATGSLAAFGRIGTKNAIPDAGDVAARAVALEADAGLRAAGIGTVGDAGAACGAGAQAEAIDACSTRTGRAAGLGNALALLQVAFLALAACLLACLLVLLLVLGRDPIVDDKRGKGEREEGGGEEAEAAGETAGEGIEMAGIHGCS